MDLFIQTEREIFNRVFDETNEALNIQGVTGGTPLPVEGVPGGEPIDINSLNPVWTRFTPPETLVTASDVGDVADTWKTQGSEIDCRGYKTITIWLNFAVNDSLLNELQILLLNISGGTDIFIPEYPTEYIKDIDIVTKVPYRFNVDGYPYIFIQTKAVTLGATPGTVTIEITKEF